MKLQKDIFLESEGDSYFNRNIEDFSKFFDPLLTTIDKIPLDSSSKINVLEIGCGNSYRLLNLKKLKTWSVYGIDPSTESVLNAKKNNIIIKKATADAIPFKDNFFDLVIFGFCLYLCDREDLFKISYETDRVLKDRSWLLIYDFWAETYKKNEYKHNEHIFSFKDDYSKMFSWHPSYTIFSNNIQHHEKHTYTDDNEEWIGISLLRKNSN